MEKKTDALLRMIHVLVREIHNRPDTSQNFRDEWKAEVELWNHHENERQWEYEGAD